MEDKITVVEKKESLLEFIKKHDKTLLIVFTILTASMYAANKYFFMDTDIMWHYKAGEYIIKNMHIPDGDIFSWQQNLEWMAHEWLYEVFLYGIYSRLGINAAKFGLPIFMSIPALIAYFYNKKKIENPYIFVAFIIAMIAKSGSSTCVRPSEISIIFFIWACILVWGENKYKYIYFFICCMISVNFHGGSIASLVILPLLCLVSDLIVDYWKEDNKDILAGLKGNLYMFAAGFLGSLLNPYGIYIYKYAYQTFGYAANYISEWKSLEFDVFAAIILIVVLLAMGRSSMLEKLDKRDIRKYIIACAFIAKGMNTGRIYYNAVVVMMLIAYPCIEELLSYTYKKLLESNKLPWFIVVLAGCVCVLTFASLYVPKLFKNESYIEYAKKEHKSTPAIEYINSNGLGNRKIFNQYNISGFLILNDIKVFIDARTDPYMKFFSTNDSLKDYFEMVEAKNKTLGESWEELNKKYAFEYAIFEKEVLVDRELIEALKSRNYEVLFEDDNVAFFKIGE
jgi:hypothetical protein